MKKFIYLFILSFIFWETLDYALARRVGRVGGSNFRSSSSSYSRSYSRSSSRSRGYSGYGSYRSHYYDFDSSGGTHVVVHATGVIGNIISIIMTIIFVIIFAYVFWHIAKEFMAKKRKENGEIWIEDNCDIGEEEPHYVIKFQIAFLCTATDVWRHLNHFASIADTAPGNYRKIVTEWALLVLRNMKYIKYADYKQQKVSSAMEAEVLFNRISLTKQATGDTGISNVNGQVLHHVDPIDEIDGKKLNMQMGEYVVVTLALATSIIGFPSLNKLSPVMIRSQVRLLGSLLEDSIAAVEVLWTPETEKGQLSSSDLLYYFPDLQLLQ